MNSWGYKINQWNLWQRTSFLFVFLFIVLMTWYFVFEKPLFENNKIFLDKQAQNQALVKELNAFLALKNNFVYKNALQSVQVKPIFRGLKFAGSGITITNYIDNPSVILPAGASQFSQLSGMLQAPLLSAIRQSSTTIVLSGGFNNFISYMHALQDKSKGIYFDSIDFNMNHYPKAEITITVFTLEGG